jgi:hypothetical protein
MNRELLYNYIYKYRLMDEIKNIYFKFFPDGKEREKWPKITYLCIKPVWIRFSDFKNPVPDIYELTF